MSNPSKCGKLLLLLPLVTNLPTSFSFHPPQAYCTSFCRCATTKMLFLHIFGRSNGLFNDKAVTTCSQVHPDLSVLPSTSVMRNQEDFVSLWDWEAIVSQNILFTIDSLHCERPLKISHSHYWENSLISKCRWHLSVFHSLTRRPTSWHWAWINANLTAFHETEGSKRPLSSSSIEAETLES